MSKLFQYENRTLNSNGTGAVNSLSLLEKNTFLLSHRIDSGAKTTRVSCKQNLKHVHYPPQCGLTILCTDHGSGYAKRQNLRQHLVVCLLHWQVVFLYIPVRIIVSIVLDIIPLTKHECIHRNWLFCLWQGHFQPLIFWFNFNRPRLNFVYDYSYELFFHSRV